MDRSGTIFQINVSRGGVPKRPIPEATVGANGITVDSHSSSGHGGPAQALCLFSIERLVALREAGHDVSPGATGENITTIDLDWRHVAPGARLRLGADLLIEITGYAAPCWKNARWFKNGDFNQLDESLHPGRGRVYARVLSGGIIRQGDAVIALDETSAERIARLQPRTFRWPRDFRGATV